MIRSYSGQNPNPNVSEWRQGWSRRPVWKCETKAGFKPRYLVLLTRPRGSEKSEIDESVGHDEWARMKSWHSQDAFSEEKPTFLDKQASSGTFSK